MQPALWRMSRKDGKAVLLGAEEKRETDVLEVNKLLLQEAKVVAEACPVKIIKTAG